MRVVAVVSRVVGEEGVTHFRYQYLPLPQIENLLLKHEMEFLVCNIIVKMMGLSMRMVESVMVSQTFVMEHRHSWKIVGQMNHHNIGMDPLQRLMAVGKNHMKSGPVEMTVEVAFFDPNSHNLELDFVSEEGQKRVSPYEVTDVKADFDIAQACHTKRKLIMN